MKKDEFKQAESKLILHIPHSSMHIPKKYRKIFIDGKVLERELNCMTDRYTDELFASGDARVVMPVSRLLCDVERFRNPKEEIMTKKGMWICYTHTSDEERLAGFDNAHVEEILTKYYDVHHHAFTEAVKNKLTSLNEALIIDCHSFPSVPLLYETAQRMPRTDICLGTDAFHTSPCLVEVLKKYFTEQGLSVGVNSPFAGSIVPLKYYGREKRVQSVMIEVNRSLYMDERTQVKKDSFVNVQKMLSGALNLCREEKI